MYVSLLRTCTWLYVYVYIYNYMYYRTCMYNIHFKSKHTHTHCIHVYRSSPIASRWSTCNCMILWYYTQLNRIPNPLPNPWNQEVDPFGLHLLSKLFFRLASEPAGRLKVSTVNGWIIGDGACNMKKPSSLYLSTASVSSCLTRSCESHIPYGPYIPIHRR